MKIFLDVGANTGQSLKPAMEWGFDKFICFEPAPSCWPRLRELADHRVRIEKFGLWNKDCEAEIFQPGSKGAGLWKKDKGIIEDKARVKFVRASTWFAEHMKHGDEIYLKMNCEGAECDIMDDLLDSGEFSKVTYAMIDFDVRKIAAMKHREAEIRQRLVDAGYTFPQVSFSRDVMVGETHSDRIKNWLRVISEA